MPQYTSPSNISMYILFNMLANDIQVQNKEEVSTLLLVALVYIPLNFYVQNKRKIPSKLWESTFPCVDP